MGDGLDGAGRSYRAVYDWCPSPFFLSLSLSFLSRTFTVGPVEPFTVDVPLLSLSLSFPLLSLSRTFTVRPIEPVDANDASAYSPQGRRSAPRAD
jgi:hypothetical protein